MTRFEFVACSELVQILGLRADDERELAEILEEVSPDSVHYHTRGHFLRHGFVGAPYPNDFATWAAIQVRDRVLGERLSMVSPLDFPSLDALREEILGIIDDHLSHLSIVPRVVFGEPFEFMQSRVVEVPTGVTADTLETFRAGLAVIPPSAVYFHTIEAPRRLARSETDFAAWLREGLGLTRLTAAFNLVDPYATSLEGLRTELMRLCDAELGVSLGDNLTAAAAPDTPGRTRPAAGVFPPKAP
jgi:hypothetical protein